MLKEAYGDEWISQASFYRWFNRFSETNEQVKHEPRSGAPKSASKEENIQEVQRLVMQDRRMSVRMISEAVGISIGTVDTILTKDLKLHRVCAKFVPKILSENNQWWFHSCHKGMMANRGMKPAQHPPYSPDLPSPLRLLSVPTHERQPQENQIPVNRGAEKGIEKIPKKITEEGLRGGVPGLEATHEEVCRCRRNYFEGD